MYGQIHPICNQREGTQPSEFPLRMVGEQGYIHDEDKERRNCQCGKRPDRETRSGGGFFSPLRGKPNAEWHQQEPSFHSRVQRQRQRTAAGDKLPPATFAGRAPKEIETKDKEKPEGRFAQRFHGWF